MKPTRILFLYLLSVLIVACNKEVPTRVQITPNQLNIEGKTAHVVRTDTSTILLVRDSLAKDDGLYIVRTTLSLILDSVYYSDQMEDSLRLKLHSSEGQEIATLFPTDTLIADTLISYLRSMPGKRIAISFEGEMSGESIIT